MGSIIAATMANIKLLHANELIHAHQKQSSCVLQSMIAFKKIYIEITNSCNLSCSFCHKSSRTKAFMSVKNFTEILGRVAGYTKHLYLHVLGEPTLHPDLEEFLALSHRQGFSVNLTTNGSLVSHHEHVLLTSPAIRQINISLHSFSRSPEILKTDYLGPINSFLLKSQAKHIFINLRLWDVQKDRVTNATKFDFHILDWLQKTFALPSSFAEGLEVGKSLNLAPKVFLSRERRFTWPQLTDTTRVSTGSCRGLRDHIAILVDGSVVPCCLDADGIMTLGNILNQSLSAILAQPRAQKISEGFRQHQLVEELCQGCDYRHRFR